MEHGLFSNKHTEERIEKLEREVRFLIFCVDLLADELEIERVPLVKTVELIPSTPEYS